MHSLRTKITFLTVCAVVVTMVVAAALGVTAIRNIGSSSSDQILLLLCQTGEKNLDDYFENVQQSMSMVSAYVESDLDGIEDDKLQAHLDRVSDIFKKLTYNANGVLTYYYRIDPEISDTVKGFWYVNQGDEGFLEHEVTDITQYDTEDTSALVWFTVPKREGKAVWLPPYITDNLGARVLSYNVPIYFKGRFVGVAGIELDYSILEEQVNNITLYNSGYAFINDSEGTIICHPHMSVEELVENHPKVPEGLLSHDKFINYTYDGVEKEAVWLSLINGMRLNVTVPVSEINAGWQKWGNHILIVFAVLLAIFILVIMHFTERITKPLRDLTAAANQVNEGDFDFRLEYEGDDEVGILTRTFSNLIAHLKVYISDLSDLAYADALTSVRNKGAFNANVRKLQEALDEAKMLESLHTEPGNETALPAFAVCIFDCNDLKAINDRYGHDKGDIYLRTACSRICNVFSHSPVYRIGGDEFATILMNNDYEKREELARQFEEGNAAGIYAGIFAGKNSGKYAAENVGKYTGKNAGAQASKGGNSDGQDNPADPGSSPWEQVNVSWGMAVYDPAKDSSVADVARRADDMMYQDKRRRKVKA